MKKLCILICLIVVASKVFAQLPPLPPRPAVNASLAPFYHGIASGDPLTDRVIIWTRVTPTAATPISVDWQVANDSLFTSIVQSGTQTTDSNVDYTIKVDVTGLSANHWYYYRFKTGAVYSITGRTKTLPTGDIDSIRIAFVSCSDFQEGYFNVYNDLSKRNDLSAIIHLGDFYYEYLAGGGGATGDTNRYHPATHDASSLADYRLWESQYKLDQDLRGMLQQYPFIMVWDDHEVCNNAWYIGAENHNSSTQGNWFDRKRLARKAYFEWNPIRANAPGNDSIIHRNFLFGKLFSLVMLDTRIEGRDSSLGIAVPVTNAYMNDTNRTLLGASQLAWFKTQLSDTVTKWKVIGQQVMVAPLTMNVFGSTVVLNGDQWDGYPAERKRVLRHISANDLKDVVFITGDIHSSWANDVPSADSTYVSATGAGSTATEFVCSSVTSSAFIPYPPATIIAADPWFKYIDFSKRGYLLADINKTRFQGDYLHVSNISTRSYTTTDDAQWVNLNNEKHLRIGSGPLNPAFGNNPPLVSPFPSSTNVPHISTQVVILKAYPNPTDGTLNVQYYSDAAVTTTLTLLSVDGKVKKLAVATAVRGINNITFDLSGVASGIYNLLLSDGKATVATKIEKL